MIRLLKLCCGWLPVLLMPVLTLPVFASDPAVVNLAPNVSLQLHGIAVAQQLRSDYYIGALYLPEWSPDPNQAGNETVPKRLSMKLLVDRLSAREFQRHWKELIALNNPRSSWQPQGERILKFANAFQDGLQRGDQIDFDFLPGQGTRIRLNGDVLATISGDGFYPLLLSAWLGDIPPSKAFQSALLGGQDAETRARLLLSFDTIPVVTRPLTALASANPPPQATTAIAANSSATNPVTANRTTTNPITTVPAPSKPVAKKPAPTSVAKAATAAVPPAPVSPTAPAPAIGSGETAPTSAPPVVATATDPTPVEPPAASEAVALVDEDLLLGEYKRTALQKIRKQLVYPPRAWRLGLTGSGVIRIQIDREGNVLANTVVVSTGQMILDQAMVTMVERSLPLAPLPAEVSVNSLSLEIPVDFVR